ncbi:MAG: GNAT family N-acetyltransferase [Pseudomonadota bacterium]
MTLNIKIATDQDINDLAYIHWQSKIVAEKNIVPDDFLDSLSHEEYIGKWQDWMKDESIRLIAHNDEGTAVGFSSFGNLRTPPPGTSKIRPLYSSEIYAIYVLPEFFGQDIGTHLFKAAANHLLENKHKSLCLWALEKNKRACGFYTAMGGQRIGKMFAEMGGARVKEVCYGWRNLKECVS